MKAQKLIRIQKKVLLSVILLRSKWFPKMLFSVLVLLSFSVSSVALNSKTDVIMSELKIETATLGAGCFWCVEAIFQRVNGVETVVSGYSGGKISNPTYKEVSSGLTEHAEVVQVKFNPDVISYAQILEIFFKTHNPTMLNRQGADIGSQYRSVIFYHSDEQKRMATDIMAMLSKEGIWRDPIVTELTEFSAFYEAEKHHQDYFVNNKRQPYCQMVIVPKLDKLERVFSKHLKD